MSELRHRILPSHKHVNDIFAECGFGEELTSALNSFALAAAAEAVRIVAELIHAREYYGHGASSDAWQAGYNTACHEARALVIPSLLAEFVEPENKDVALRILSPEGKCWAMCQDLSNDEGLLHCVKPTGHDGPHDYQKTFRIEKRSSR